MSHDDIAAEPSHHPADSALAHAVSLRQHHDADAVFLARFSHLLILPEQLHELLVASPDVIHRHHFEDFCHQLYKIYYLHVAKFKINY